MSTQDKLRERVEALEATIDELQSEGRSLAEREPRSELSRRGVLGLGAAFGGLLGAGSTPARAGEASGSVGTPAAPVDVHALGLEAATADVEEVRADELNGTLFAEPGELQETIDEAAGRGGDTTVFLLPHTTYDEGEEVHVKEGVTLDYNGATLEVSGDHNGLFLDNGCAVRNGATEVTVSEYTSSAILLDQTRAVHGKYGAGGARDTSASYEGYIWGQRGDTGATGLHLRTDASDVEQGDAGISLGCKFSGAIVDFDEGLRADCLNGGWINAVTFHMDIVSCLTGVLHTGDYNFESTLYGDIQTPWESGATALKNETADGNSITHYGRVWDVSDDQWFVDGPNINHISPAAHRHVDRVRNANRSVAFRPGGYGRFEVYRLGADVALSIRFTNTRVRFFTADDTEVFSMRNDGRVKVVGDGWFELEREDLSQREGASWGEIAVDDGTNTDSGNPAPAIWYGGEWHVCRVANSIAPA